MILLVRRHKIALLVLFALAFALGMGVFAYLSLQGFGALSDLEQKTLAERVFLAGVVGTLGVFGGLLMVVHDAVNLNAVFKRLAGMHRMSGDQIQMELRTLGSVGERIGSLYSSINALSARKSTRISGLNALLTTVLRKTDANMLVVNAGGKVYQATPAALERFELTHAEIMDRPVDDLLDAGRFTEISAAISRGTGSYRIGEAPDSIVVLPVTNDQGLVAYYVYLLGNDAREELMRDPVERRKPREAGGKRSETYEKNADAGNSPKNRRPSDPDRATGAVGRGEDEKTRGELMNGVRSLLARLGRKPRDR